jgi:WD40 repeat protein
MVAFAPDGNRLASASLDQTVRLWDTAAGTEMRRFPKLAGPVHAVCFSPHGNRLVSTSGHWDNCQASEVKVWDPATGDELLAFAEKETCGLLGAAFAPDGKTLVTAGGRSDSVHLWDPATGQEKDPGGAAHCGSITALAYAPDGRTLASAGEQSVRLWDPATARQIRRLEHADEVMTVAFSPEGQWLASGGLGGRIHLWDADTGKEIRVLRGHRSGDRSRFTLLNGKEIQRWGGGPPSVNSLAFAPDRQTLYSGGKIIRRWQIPSGRELPPFPEQQGEVFRIAVSPDGRTVASGHHDEQGPRICLWDSGTGRRRRTIECSGKWITHVLFSPDGSQLASSGFDGVVRLWDVRTGRRLHRFVPEARPERRQPNCCCVAFAPDGKTLAVGGWDQTIHLYDLATGRKRRGIAGHQGWISALAFAPDGKRLATGSQDTTVLVWDVIAGRK